MQATVEKFGYGQATAYTEAFLDRVANQELIDPTIPPLPARPWRIIGDITEIAPLELSDSVGTVKSEWVVDPEHEVFGQHFPKRPIMPGLYMADQLCQLAGFYAGHMGARGDGVATGIKDASFKAMILPTVHKIKYEVSIISHASGPRKSIVRANGKLWADEELALTVDKISVLIQATS